MESVVDVFMESKDKVAENCFFFILGEADQTILFVQTIHDNVMAGAAWCISFVRNLLFVTGISGLKIKTCGK